MARAIAELQKQDIQSRLEGYLDRLKGILEINEDLKVIWSPNGKNGLAGEVRGKTIFLYEADFDSASTTLRHEVIDYLVCRAIEPYKEIANKLVLLLNEKAYRDKEAVVEKLCRLVDIES